MAVVDLRYARAFSQVVSEQKLDAAAATAQLNDFVATLESSAELREVLGDPSIAEAQKLGVLDGIAGKVGMAKATRNLVAVIIHHQRLQELREIVAAVATLADESRGFAEAEIVSAFRLDDGNRALLEEKIGKLAGGARVRATYSEDAALLGGAVVTLGSTVYDGSVRAQLQQLKQKLVSASAN